MHSTKEHAVQTNNLICNWKLRADCDKGNIPWAGNMLVVNFICNSNTQNALIPKMVLFMVAEVQFNFCVLWS